MQLTHRLNAHAIPLSVELICFSGEILYARHDMSLVLMQSSSLKTDM